MQRAGRWVMAASLGAATACGASDPFPGTFAGSGTASTGDASGANATTQTAAMQLDIAVGPDGDGGLLADGAVAAPYVVHIAAAFDGSAIGAVDCTLSGVYGPGPSVMMLAGQTCDASVSGASTTLTLFAGQAAWNGTAMTATLIWAFASGRTRWTVAATRQ